jgi:hypothetical protein
MPVAPWQGVGVDSEVEDVEQVEEPAARDHAPDDVKAQCQVEGVDDNCKAQRKKHKKHKKHKKKEVGL